MRDNRNLAFHKRKRFIVKRRIAFSHMNPFQQLPRAGMPSMLSSAAAGARQGRISGSGRHARRVEPLIFDYTLERDFILADELVVEILPIAFLILLHGENDRCILDLIILAVLANLIEHVRYDLVHEIERFRQLLERCDRATAVFRLDEIELIEMELLADDIGFLALVAVVHERNALTGIEIGEVTHFSTFLTWFAAVHDNGQNEIYEPIVFVIGNAQPVYARLLPYLLRESVD